ncbi:MAG: ComF family protein [Deltaproteobacteria bacterium]|nr:ComF family protein [Deltaproteobacteria bacterium]
MTPLKQLAQIIYPPRCVICGDFLWRAPLDAGESPNPICRNCSSDFSPIEAPLCTICGKPFGSNDIENHPCEDCLRKKPFFEGAYAPFIYDGSILEAVLRFKYGQKTFMADALGPLLTEFVKARFTLREPFLIMPVPLHPKRLRERGFNQSLLLAKQIALGLGGKVDFLSLVRTKHTIPQTTLSKKERRKNVQNAFLLKNPESVRERNILLVDDVTTTGNTLNECAKVLTQAGAQPVFCVTLAKAVI